MKNNIRIVVADLDGTLLRSDKTISERTRVVFAKCQDAGIKVVYATGRGGSAEQVAPSGIFDARITMNGAVAYIGDEVVYQRLIPHDIARPVLMACDRYGLKTTSELSGMHYSNFIVSDEWATITNFEIVDFASHDIDAEKLYMIVRSPEDAAFIESQLPETLYLTVSNDGLGQVMHKDATKSKAVAELAKYWGVSQSEIVAFGDDLNDIDLLTYAGVGIAMDNAHDDVKASADIICSSNDDDGIAEWLESNLL